MTPPKKPRKTRTVVDDLRDLNAGGVPALLVAERLTEWGGKRAGSGRKTGRKAPVFLQVRVDDALKEAVRAYCTARTLDVSEWVRGLIRSAMRK